MNSCAIAMSIFKLVQSQDYIHYNGFTGIMENSVDPDQLASSQLIWSHTVFVQGHSVFGKIMIKVKYLLIRLRLNF